MNVGIFAVITLVAGYDEQALPHRRLPRPRLSLAASRQPAHLLPHLAHRHSLHRRLLRQVLLLLSRSRRRRHLARHHRPAQLRISRRLLPAPRRWSPRSARLPDEKIAAPKPAGRSCRHCRPLLAAAATLVLGIVPGATLDAAQSAAHTLQAPPMQVSSPAPAVTDPAPPPSPLQSPQ